MEGGKNEHPNGDLPPLIRGTVSSAQPLTPNVIFWNGRHIDIQQFIKELVDPGPDSKNMKGISIAILVIILILGSVALSIALLSKPPVGPAVVGSRFSIENLLNTSLLPRNLNASWISDSELVFLDPSGGLSRLTLPNKTLQTILKNSVFRQFNAKTFSVSQDRKYVLLSYNINKDDPDDPTAQYVTVNIKTGSVWNVKLETGLSMLSFVAWARVGSGLLIGAKGSVYFTHQPNGNFARIVSDDDDSTLLYGIPHILYKEYFWSAGYWFSGSGGLVVVSVFNLSQECNRVNLGCELITKVGSPLPDLRLLMVDVSSGSIGTKSYLQIENARDYYVSSVSWISDSTVSLTLINRSVNESRLVFCSSPSWKCEQVYTDIAIGRPSFSSPLVIRPGSFIVKSSVRDGDAGHFMHIVLVESERRIPLTLGRFTVIDILAWDNASNFVYFTAVYQDQPEHKHLYRVPGDNNGSLSTPECISCTANSTINAQNCTHAQPTLSPGFDYWILSCLGPNLPYSILYQTDSPEPLMYLDTNSDMHQKIKDFAMPRTLESSVLTGSGTAVRVKLYLPPDTNTNQTTKYPLVIHLCENIGCQSISARWSLSFTTVLSSSSKMIVCEVDGRGSGGRGEDHLLALRRTVGKVDIQDIVQTVRKLISKYNFIDPDRIAVIGRRYGGFLVANLLSQDRLFKCGVAVSPIVDWRHADALVGEQYFGSPNETANFAVYESGSLSGRAKLIPSDSLLLVHGTKDRIVPLQTSMFLAKELAAHQVLFRQQIYTDEGHSLQGVSSHYLHSVQNFLNECLDNTIQEEKEEP